MQRRSITKPLRETAPSGLAALPFALLSLAVALLAIAASLMLVVLIESLVWHLLASLPLLAIGTTALLLFADGLDRTLVNPKVRSAAGLVHWLAAAMIALAIAVLLGIPAASVFGYAPATGWAILIDAVIGVIAGGLMVVVVTSTGSVLGRFVACLQRLLGAGRKRAAALRAPFREEWSWLELGRGVVVGVSGVLLSAGLSALFGPSTHKPRAAADTLPAHASGSATLVWPLLGWLLGTGAVWVLFAWLPSMQIAPGRGKRHAGHATALSAALLIAIAWASASFLDDNARGSLSAGTHRVPQLTLPGASLTASPALARSFAPTIELAPGEPWSPTSVDWYRANATTDAHDQFCGGKKPRGHCLRLACPTSGARTCEPCDSSDPPAECAPRGAEHPALYYRYYTPANARSVRDKAPGADHDWTVIQYWIFYNYDSLNAGIVTQWHESDWEQVSVLVKRKRGTVRPVEVAFSEHCYGAVVPAGQVAWSGSHPISYSGLGSHGNYPSQNDLPIRELQCLTRTAPRYLGVSGLFFDPNLDGSAAELPLAYLISLRDRTGHTRTVSQPELIYAPRMPLVIDFDGYWGVDNNLTVVAGRLRTGTGPRSPQAQNPWLTPFRSMFCAPTWLHVPPRDRKATQWVCG